jgi:hypothetical protein
MLILKSDAIQRNAVIYLSVLVFAGLGVDPPPPQHLGSRGRIPITSEHVKEHKQLASDLPEILRH